MLAGKNIRGMVVHKRKRMPTSELGRRRELELVRAALASGAHILLEGPPGTGKSTLLRQVARSRHTEFVLVEGSAELTPARLVGALTRLWCWSRGTGRRTSPTGRWSGPCAT